jgi:hypothetical protein
MKATRHAGVGVLVGLAAVAAWACNDDDDKGVGTSCKSAEQCFAGVTEQIEGETLCLDKVTGGYCTHECDTDADCCSVAGECPNKKTQVCGPFESTGQRMCFLSCEGEADGNAFCARYAHADFGCRSTGGGSANRKVCVPN